MSPPRKHFGQPTHFPRENSPKFQAPRIRRISGFASAASAPITKLSAIILFASATFASLL
jgi:hypothetical protein